MYKTLLATLALIAVSAPSTAQEELYDHAKVRDFYLTFKQPNWWQLLKATESTGADIKADLKVDGKDYLDIGIRIKGSSSNKMPGNKKPFNLTLDAFTPGQNLLGVSTINLNNGAVDPTMTREVTSFRIMRDYLPAPRTAYGRIHLNGTFWGVYILVEQTNKAFASTWFRDKDGTRYKGDAPAATAINSSTLEWFGPAVSEYQKRYEIKTPTHPNAWTDLVNLIDKLNNTSDKDFEKEIVKWVDVDRVLWYYACNNLIVNTDDYVGTGHNYYMYFNPADGRMNMVAVDCNEAYGVHWPPENPHKLDIFLNGRASNRPLIRRIMAVPKWLQTYLAHYRTLVREWSDWDSKLGPLTKELQDSIRADIARDPHYFYTQAQFDPSAPRFFSVFHFVPPLKKTIIDRRNWLLTVPELARPTPDIRDVTWLPAGTKVPAGTRVQVTARVTGTPAIRSVTLRSSIVGPYTDHTMYDDGLHGDGGAGDGVWGGSFVAGNYGETTRFYLVAENADDTLEFSPPGAEHSHYSVESTFPNPTGPIVINEVLASNDSGDKDERGQFEDWVELHNRGQVTYDLSGHWLSDEPATPRKWQIPADTKIAPGAFVRVWCDNDLLDGKLHANFKLSKEGETVALYDTDARSNALLDGIAFGQQASDRSFGRFPDGENTLHFMWQPTGEAAQISAATIRRYDGRVGGSARGLTLDGVGAARIGQTFGWSIAGGPPSGPAVIFLSGTVASEPFGIWGHIDVGPVGFFALPIGLDANGGATLSTIVPTSLAGGKLYQQAFALDLSNGVGVWFR